MLSDEFEQPQQESKSQRKRDMAALQKLGEELTKLSPTELARVDLPEALREAIEAARRIHKRGAHQRQLQYIGRLIRGVDAAPIRAGLDRLKGTSREAAALQHRIEHWRERLLAGGDAEVAELIETYPAVDRQRLHQLVRNAKQEHAAQRPPRFSRELFRFLRDLMAP